MTSLHFHLKELIHNITPNEADRQKTQDALETLIKYIHKRLSAVEKVVLRGSVSKDTHIINGCDQFDIDVVVLMDKPPSAFVTSIDKTLESCVRTFREIFDHELPNDIQKVKIIKSGVKVFLRNQSMFADVLCGIYLTEYECRHLLEATPMDTFTLLPSLIASKELRTHDDFSDFEKSTIRLVKLWYNHFHKRLESQHFQGLRAKLACYIQRLPSCALERAAVQVLRDDDHEELLEHCDLSTSFELVLGRLKRVSYTHYMNYPEIPDYNIAEKFVFWEELRTHIDDSILTMQSEANINDKFMTLFGVKYDYNFDFGENDELCSGFWILVQTKKEKENSCRNKDTDIVWINTLKEEMFEDASICIQLDGDTCTYIEDSIWFDYEDDLEVSTRPTVIKEDVTQDDIDRYNQAMAREYNGNHSKEMEAEHCDWDFDDSRRYVVDGTLFWECTMCAKRSLWAPRWNGRHGEKHQSPGNHCRFKW